MSAPAFAVDTKEVLQRILKYVIQGLAIGLAALIVPEKKPSWEEVLVLALTAAAVFSLLDMFAPAVGVATRYGTGLGIGASLTPLGKSMMSR
jgi:preprotein translocase subunit Sss1